MRQLRQANTNIFESNSQLLAIDPARIKPVFDRILCRDIKEDDKIGSLWIPATAAERGVGKNGLLREGIVVAVGPGDPWAKEKPIKGGTQVSRTALGKCGGPHRDYPCDRGKIWDVITGDFEDCPACKGDGIRRWPMYCKPGDRILYDRRKEAELFIDGVRYGLLHEEQSVFAVLEGRHE